MTAETWKRIDEFPDYEVSDLGRVKRVVPDVCSRRCALLTPTCKRNGYEQVGLRLHGKRRWLLVHRLVCIAFRGDPPTPEHIVAHADGSRNNNKATNLRWATFKENQADMICHGTMRMGEDHWSRKSPGKVTRGEKHGSAKLTPTEIKAIRATLGTCAEVSLKFGVNASTISSIRNHKTWSHIA